MSVLEAVLLGLVQGLTEFLPVSSSGHLVLAQRLLGVREAALSFDVMVHLGTLVAVLVAFWPDVRSILQKPFSRLTYLLVAGTIPTGIIGYYLQDFFASLFASGQSLGVEFILTGVILWAAESARRGRKSMERISFLDAFLIGTAQGLAILPAISRSGLTIAASLLRGLKREDAARFSFLLSIPAILGAGLVEGKTLLEPGASTLPAAPLLWGTLAAAVSGYLAIRVMLRVLNRGSLRPFSYYVWIIGALVLLDQLFTRLFFPPLF